MLVCHCEDFVLFTTASRFLPHSQRLLHSTARLYVLPEGRRCEGDGPFAWPGLCEGQAWRWGVTGMGSAKGYICRDIGVSFCVVPRKLVRRSLIRVPAEPRSGMKVGR